MATIMIELSGGPRDGQTINFTEFMMQPYGGNLPEQIDATRRVSESRNEDQRAGWYVKTRKLSRTTGRLMYEWRSA